VTDPEIILITEPTSLERLTEVAASWYGDMVKAVVDIDRRVMAIGGDLQSDEETILIQNGSEQRRLWGINIYPGKPRSEWIEFDSMINIRPRDNNRSRYVEDAPTRALITEIVDSLVQ
jgi:hypothetical protein